MFENFTERAVATGRGTVFARVGGSGPPILLLHGYPQTHLMWHTTAALLSDRHTVVVADLPGYGASFRPTPTPDHAAHSKRALALDLTEAMSALGHETFAVVGHDRGGRVAYRMALDHPGRVTAAAALDVVPTGEVWARADAAMALGYWHWAFLAQPAPLPERLIGADPDAFFDLHVRALGLGAAPDRYPPDLMAAYRELLDDPEIVEAICEDYRAGAGIDREHDDADRGRRYIECPLLALWSARGALPRFYGDVLDVWRPWARRVAGRGLDASHFLVEDQPEQVAEIVSGFLEGAGPARRRFRRPPPRPETLKERTEMTPTIVLVHGAYAESSSWDGLLDRLPTEGRVIAFANPLRSLASDTALLTDLIRTLDGPVVLVGHSYGGAVISGVPADAGDVVALVYIAGFALAPGESAGDASALVPGSTLGDTLVPVPLAGGGTDTYIAQEKYHAQFCADLPADQAARMAITQRPVTQEALFEPAGQQALWQTVPSWFVFGELDHNIPVGAHRIMAERADARRTVEIAGASHVVGISHADEVANLVLDALDRTAVAS